MNPTEGSGEELLRSALNKAELEALEALKLQYFQNATRFLAKGEYDSALAEIKRVLLIDPEHRLAREYEVRVAELQASRVQLSKAEPTPPREIPKVAPVPPPAAVETTAPTPRRPSRKALLYIALFAFLLLGTTGVLTLEKAGNDEQPAAAVMAAVAPQVSAPVEQSVDSMVVEEPAPLIEPPPTIEPTRTPVVAEKSAPKPEPARQEPPPPVTPAEKNVEPPPAPVQKELPVLQPEVMVAAIQPTPATEPVRESAAFVAVQQDPKIVRLEKPRLPDIVLQNHISGSVTAKVLIDRDGRPQEVNILTSTSSVFEQPVIDAINNSTFAPGMMGTGPVAAWVVIPFKFK